FQTFVFIRMRMLRPVFGRGLEGTFQALPGECRSAGSVPQSVRSLRVLGTRAVLATWMPSFRSMSSVACFVSVDGDLVSVGQTEWLGPPSWMMPELLSGSAAWISFDGMS